MKKIIPKMSAAFAILLFGGFALLYYEYQGGSGASQDAVVAMNDDMATDTDVMAVEASSDYQNKNLPKSATHATIHNSSSPKSQIILPIVPASSASSSPTPSTTSRSIPVDLPPAVSSAPSTISPTICAFPDDSASTTRAVVLNEIAWMGSLPGVNETNAKASQREWIELKNISGQVADLSGWQVIDKAGGFDVRIGSDGSDPQLLPGDFYLLVRGGQSIGLIPADGAYAGTLSNSGNALALVDARCDLEDMVDASSGWPGGNNTTKQTMERDGDGIGWHTSVTGGGTPRAENSIPPIANISIATPSVAAPSPGGSTSSVIATNPPSPSSPSLPASSSPTVSSSTSGPAHLLIADVQIAGASSSNDLVKIYNPTGASVDLSGWKLHKRSSTGTDYSLKTFPQGIIITPGEYLVWANGSGGFADVIGANVSSTETLSADNSVALIDANGGTVDAVAWGMGTGQYVEGLAFPTSPAAGQMLSRRIVGGVMSDTDSNADDFQLQ